MSNIVRPNINTVGSFNVASPYDSIVNNLEEYKVESIRSLQEMIDGNENPLDTVYVDVGRTEEDMKHDIQNGVMIVVMVDSSGGYAYIPETKFLSAPDTTGIRYQEKVLGINLGLLETSMDLTSLKSDILAMISDRIGIEANAQEVEKSAILRIPKDKHNYIQQNRELVKNIRPSYYFKYLECREHNKILAEENNRLSCFVTSKLSAGMSNLANRNRYAINTDSELINYKVRLATNIRLNNCKGVEVYSNVFAIHDSLANTINLVRFDSNSVAVVKTKSIPSFNKVAIYVVNGILTVVGVKADSIEVITLDEDLITVDTGTINSLNNPNLYSPIQGNNDYLTIGIGNTNQGKVYKLDISTTGTVAISSEPIQDFSTNDTPLSNGDVFNILEMTTTGLIIFDTYIYKFTISNGDFTKLSTQYSNPFDIKADFVMSVTVGRYEVVTKLNNTVQLISIGDDAIIAGVYSDTTYPMTDFGYCVTLDRSLLILTNKQTTDSMEIKKYI